MRGTFFNRADFLIGEPNQSLYVWKDVSQVPIAVVDELPFRIAIEQPRVPIVQNGSMQLKIVAHRNSDWDEPITVRMPFLPPGVSSATTVTIEKGQTEVLLPLNANGDAAVGNWRVFALGQAEIAGTAFAASQLAELEVAAPLVTFEVQRAACEQGQTAQIYCKLNHLRPFEGPATARLLGLPHQVTAEELQFTKDTTDLTFTIVTDASSPAGKHGGLLCQITIQRDGEPIVSTAGVTELQIDEPTTPIEPAEEPVVGSCSRIQRRQCISQPKVRGRPRFSAVGRKRRTRRHWS